ncbi:MAG: FHA domain-containing protein [Streptomycetales bacterium]
MEAEPMPFCTQCGHHNPDDARFCSSCGAALWPVAGADRTGDSTSTVSITGIETFEGERTAELSAADQAAVDALPPGSALLVVQRGPNSGSRFLLDAEVTSAGRHPESDIFLDDVTVSRRHAEFRRAPEGFVVHDVGSLNGTYVNRERIDQALLSGGDEVQIGKYRLVFFPSHHPEAGGEVR